MMGSLFFHDRAEAGRLLAEALRDATLEHPLVLAIPRGGVEVGAVLALELGADLDVILARKLRSPLDSEMALGAVSESGEVVLNRHAGVLDYGFDAGMEEERRHQVAEIERRRKTVRASVSPLPIEGRSVIVVDDGMATGSTMVAALRTVWARRPREVIVALPVAPAERLDDVRSLSDRVVCLIAARTFSSVGAFYERFGEVSDERVVELLREGQRRP
jgi:predicted phosphoribosyltransferase